MTLHFQGEEILSQVSVADTETNETMGDVSEIPSDDDSDVVSVIFIFTFGSMPSNKKV